MRPRRASEAGHSRKFLVVIDESPECARAAVYAAKRAARTGGGLTMLYVIEPGDFQHWLGVEDIRRAAEEEFRETERQLQTRLEETEQRIASLQQ